MEEDIFNTELGKKFLTLIKAGFRVSDLISDLFLREKIKTQILNIFRIFSISSGSSGEKEKYSGLLKEMDILEGFFFFAGQLGFVKDEHFRVLKKGFSVFKLRIISSLNEPPKIVVDKTPIVKKEAVKPEVKINERQEKILEKFKEKEILKLAEIVNLFPNISEKTVRNELKLLIDLKKITRSGNGSGSFYQIMRK